MALDGKEGGKAVVKGGDIDEESLGYLGTVSRFIGELPFRLEGRVSEETHEDRLAGNDGHRGDEIAFDAGGRAHRPRHRRPEGMPRIRRPDQAGGPPHLDAAV